MLCVIYSLCRLVCRSLSMAHCGVCALCCFGLMCWCYVLLVLCLFCVLFCIVFPTACALGVSQFECCALWCLCSVLLWFDVLVLHPAFLSFLSVVLCCVFSTASVAWCVTV